MKSGKIKAACLLLLISFCFAAVSPRGAGKDRTPKKDEAAHRRMLIDDFSRVRYEGRLVPKWLLINDRTTGNASKGKIEFGEYDKKKCMHLTGSVSGRNDGGSLEARLSLVSKRKSFDAGMFEGISLRVKGNGRPYALHLQTNSTRLRGQHYRRVFKTNGKWQDIKIPFLLFTSKSAKYPIDNTSIRSVAIAARGNGFNADILIDEIAFYGDATVHKKLNPQEEEIIIHKGTEIPFTGEFDKHFEEGVYTCKRCGAALYESSSKFKSGCGWPSFDDEVPGAVKRVPDEDGIRTEITCAKCGGHLGHVFAGEGLTDKNIRHCVNSISLNFVPAEEMKTKRAIFASGCFWGTEYMFRNIPGVISTKVGYTGGNVKEPTYKQVYTGKTGHAEAVEVVYDPGKTTYEKLARLFFETHDFTQLNRQGPDIGNQYRSAAFYVDEEQKKAALDLIKVLEEKGYKVKTELTRATEFWPAELFHQDYYLKTGKQPYCHAYRKIF